MKNEKEMRGIKAAERKEKRDRLKEGWGEVENMERKKGRKTERLR